MKVRAQMAFYIFIALATLDVCSVNLISRASSFKMPQAMSPAAPARCSNPAPFVPMIMPTAKSACLHPLFSQSEHYKSHNWPRPRKRKRLLQTVLSKVPLTAFTLATSSPSHFR
jgi:hypothetical protein